MQRPRAWWRRPAGITVVVGLTGAAVLARMALDPLLGPAFPLVTLFGAIAAAVWAAGLVPAALTATLGYLACSYSFVEPRGVLTWTSTDVTGMVAYAVTCAIIIGFGEALRRARQSAFARELEMADFFENASVGLHWVGPDGTILRANHTELAILGYPMHEYVGRPIAGFHVDQHVSDDIMARLGRGETLKDYPARMRRKDGSILDVLLDSSALIEDGRLVHTRCFTRDVTGQRQAEQAQARLAAIVSSSSDAIVSKTLEGIVVSWNQAAERLFGWSAAEAIGRSIELVIPSERRHEEQMILDRLAAGEPVEHFETVRVTKDGRLVPVSLTISPVRDSTGRVIGASKVVRDISERKAREQELAEMNRRKDEFLATLAHEIRNPLAPLTTMLAVMKRANGDPALIENARATMERQVAILVRLVNDLVDVSRITRNSLELRTERLDLSEVIALAVETCQPLLNEMAHRLTVECPSEAVHVQGDPVRLVQVFSNLLNNAARYSEPNGQVSLVVRRESTTVAVQVRDRGMGIAPEHIEGIFGLFTQFRPEYLASQSGLGVGLSIVRQLVGMHGGTVTAESDGPGRGSTFTVRLPIAADPPHHGDSTHRETADVRRTGC